MRIFVAGASGAIGRVLVPLLLDAGHQVTGTARTAEGLARLAQQGADPVQLDIFDRDAVFAGVAAGAPDAIIHQLTSLADMDFATHARIRREGTRNLVDAAHAAEVHRIVAQSISWIAVPGDGPSNEETPLDIDRGSAVTGAQALEEIVAELDHHVVLRYGELYGPGTWYAPNDLVSRRLAEGTIPADDSLTSFVHVTDAARAAVSALDWPNGVVNVTDDEPAPAHEWVPALAATFGLLAPERTSGGEPWKRGASNTRAHTLGWQPLFPTWRTGFGKQMS